MSFKMVGDQYREISLVQKRRVADLLANNIPGEEAQLMKNGRYACLVCRHRPTFDTIAMLSVHRSGQKHIRAAHSLMKRKQVDREELERRDQLKQLRSEAEQMSSHGGEDSTPPLLIHAQAATSSALLPGAPYSSHSKPSHRRTPRTDQQDKQQPFFTRKRPLVAHDACSSSKKHDSGDGSKKSSHAEKSQSDTEASPHYVFPWNTGIKRRQTTGNSKDEPSWQTSTDDECGTRPEKMRHLQLCSAGWIRNPDGSWSKDPNVEFDSDEETS